MKGKIRQICIVARDGKKVMQNFWDLFGIGPWEVRHFKPDTVGYLEVGGKRLKEGFDFMAAVADAGSIQLEVVQPVEGPNVYWDTLERKGDCLHHFKIVFDTEEDINEYIAEMASKGIKVTQTGTIGKDIHAYLDTEDKLGYIVELGFEGEIGPPDYVFPEGVTRDPNRRTPNFRQIGALVPNAEEAMQNFSDLLGIGPWAVRMFRSDNLDWFEVDGKLVTEEAEYLTAVAWAGDMELEFMQPIKGPCVYCGDDRQFIPGLHHVKDVMSEEEIAKEKERLEKLGIPCLQAGKYQEDVHYYMGTKKQIGFLYELGNGAEISGDPDYYIPAQE